ncbi:probable lysophospholipase BODYGUARD 4 isoform X1 [Zingiber officinale]|uniref:AB hydrolase-1 domain-containing protein n=1 Tax=Zingiber officinale TaxID=94328 RepID=A0A8J5KVG1_ZINOF|nr:probable lysophospholipase BODYGUARD 4 isoform X1 [Zingiber officinale]KAG6497724.1 hypothetical protein ZIOFF_045628 [Zingiber officinale]
MMPPPPMSAKDSIISAISLLVFSSLDLLDFFLCYLYRFLDAILEESPVACYCRREGGGRGRSFVEEESKTIRGRRSLFRVRSGFACVGEKRDGKEEKGCDARSPRWSDCGCEACLSWQEKGKEELHLVVMDAFGGRKEEYRIDSFGSSPKATYNSVESVVFIHGFLSSSSMWVETVFPNLSQVAKQSFRMIAVDLLGFGRSPKPTNCIYTLKDHLQMIEKSVLTPLQLNSYHIVAHSMGCVIALALAASSPDSIKSITLIAPPYFESSESEASHTALNKLAARRVWPPLLFGSAVMSWYEHIGRTVCFIFCRNHLIWEWIIKLVTRKSELSFLFTDLTRHTHHSAWHTMHNVICGGAKSMDRYLVAVREAKFPVRVIQGDKDQVVPPECSYNLKAKLPFAELQVVNGRDHCSVVVGREDSLTRELEAIWFSCRTQHKMY